MRRSLRRSFRGARRPRRLFTAVARALAGAFAGAVLATCAGEGPVAPPPAGAFWTPADPAALGVDAAALEEHRRLCDDSAADACLVAHRGRLVQEWYGPTYAYPMYTMSSVKSWTGLLTGMLIADGKLAGLDAPVATYLPEWRAGAEAGVTVRHLLTMTAGLARRYGTAPGPDQSVGTVLDKNAFVLALPLDWAPGRQWAYSNEGVQLLSPLLQRATGGQLQAYARARLFGPLGMDSTRLHEYPAGQVWTYADAETTLRDFAKVCQLVLDGGRWNGVQVVPEAWVRASVAAIPQNPDYGRLWWRVPGGFATRGNLDTNCYGFPDLRLVVAWMQMRPAAKPYLIYERPSTFDLFRRMVRR